jgi:hypothetical protein
MRTVTFFTRMRPFGLAIILTLLLIPFRLLSQSIRYVDAARTTGNGQSWANAYPTLKAALDEANGNTSITEIRVAKGTYYPTGDQIGTDRNAAFGIYRRNLSILGGYPTGGVGPRNWDANPTILSGEINNPSDQKDNSYHVVVVAGQLLPATGDLTIEGFRVHWGRADGGGAENTYNGQAIKRNAGGGIAIVGQGDARWIRVRNCVVSGNYAGDVGAGVYANNSYISLIGSLISGNYANYCGGVFVYTTEAIPFRMNITNCTIVGNHANHDAGGLRISGGNTDVQLVNTVIYGNSAGVTEKEYISIKDGATYSNFSCLFQFRDNRDPKFEEIVGPGTVNIDGKYWSKYQSGSALTNQGRDNVSDLGEFDLKYNPRVACETDIGAYEYRIHPTIIEEPQSAEICSGASATFSVSLDAPGATYFEWEEKKANSGTFYKVNNQGIYSGANTATLTLRNVPFDYQYSYYELYNGSTFRCIMWNEQCAKVTSKEVVLTVEQPMNINVDPSAKSVCVGQSVTFTGNALNAKELIWEYDDGGGFKDVPATATYAGRTTKTLTINSVTAQMDGYLYRLKATSPCSGTKTSGSAKLTVPKPAAITQQPLAATVCVGANTSLTVQAAHATSYRWQYHDGGTFRDLDVSSTFRNVTTHTLEIRGATEGMPTRYRVLVGGACGATVASSEGKLTVTPLAVITQQPAEAVVACVQSGTNLSVQASNATTYRWQYHNGDAFVDVSDGDRYAGFASATLLIKSVAETMNANRYRVVVGGCGQEVTSTEVRLTVHGAPSISSQTFCEADHPTVADLPVQGGNLKWYAQPSGGSALEESALITQGTYYVSQYFNECESPRAAVEVTVNNTDMPTGNPAQTVGGGAQLSDLIVTGANLKWYDQTTGGSELATSTQLASGKYYVSQTIEGCESARLEITVTVAAGLRFVRQAALGRGLSWKDASGDIQAMIDNAGASEVWVAGGTYVPTTLAGNGSGPRDKAFVLKKGVKVYGGFAGVENALAERDLRIETNRTVLSGDFNQDDVRSGTGSSLEIANMSENAYHVVIAAGDMTGTILSGVTVQGGNANLQSAGIYVNGRQVNANSGGGVIYLYDDLGGLQLQQVVISGNYATYGGGIFTDNSSLVCENTLICHNLASEGAGIYAFVSSLTMTNVTIAGNNAADVNRQAMVNHDSETKMANSIVSGTILSFGSRPNPVYTYSVIQGLASSGTNSGADPSFVDPAGGNFQLQPCSPGVNGGDPTVSAGVDLAGQPRVQLGRLDIGAYESAQILTDDQIPMAPEGNLVVMGNQSASGETRYAADCQNLVLSVTGSGERPVQGAIQVRLWVQSTPGYVGRVYEIAPALNPSIATGKVTLYFTQAEFSAYNQEGKPNLPIDPSDRTGIQNLRIEKRSGVSSDGSGSLSSYSDESVVIDPKDEDIVWNASMSRWEVSFDVRGFSGFFAYAVDDSALPVTLVHFEAEALEESVRLRWQTTLEVNALHFEMERSNDGTHFVSIGRLAAQGEVKTLKNYVFMDNAPHAGINYYRLKMVDRDGSFSFSRVVSAQSAVPSEDLTVSVYPSPATEGYVHVAHSGDNAVKLAIYDLKGRKLPVAWQETTKGVLSLDVHTLSSGIYILQVHDGLRTKVRRFSISR